MDGPPTVKTAPPTRSSASIPAAFPSAGKSAKSNPLKKRGTSRAHKDDQLQRRKTGNPNSGSAETLNGKRKRWNLHNREPQQRTARSADNP